MNGSHRAARRGKGARHVPHHTVPHPRHHQRPDHADPPIGRQPVWKHGLAAAVVASVATTVLAAVASAAWVSFADSTGAGIPIPGFAQLTLVFSLVGVGIAASAIVVPALAGRLARAR